MATYAELRKLFTEGQLRNKIEAACIVTAEAILQEDAGVTNHANRLIWAKNNLPPSNSTRDQMLMVLLASNKDAEVAAITGVTDAVIQAKIDAAVDLFADGS